MTFLQDLWAKLIPTFLKGKEKMVAAFVTTLVLAQLAKYLPGVKLDPSVVEQVVTAVLLALPVYFTKNTPPVDPPQ